jgi:hypothetical protein
VGLAVYRASLPHFIQKPAPRHSELCFVKNLPPALSPAFHCLDCPFRLSAINDIMAFRVESFVRADLHFPYEVAKEEK